MNSNNERWYVVQSQPNAEFKAIAHLNRQGFVTYVPRYLKRRRHARRIDAIAAPLFPRYLFVTIDTTIQRWRLINSTIGVSRLVCNAEEPAPVTDNVVKALRQSEDENGLIHLPARPRFAAGEKVLIADGAFIGCIGLFEGMRDIERVSVLLDLLGRKVRVVLDAELISAA